jgi:hypothetical protein
MLGRPPQLLRKIEISIPQVTRNSFSWGYPDRTIISKTVPSVIRLHNKTLSLYYENNIITWLIYLSVVIRPVFGIQADRYFTSIHKAKLDSTIVSKISHRPWNFYELNGPST